jgi:hypothetical protein
MSLAKNKFFPRFYTLAKHQAILVNLIFQELQDLYCQSWPADLTCTVDGGQADCSGMGPREVEDNICSLKKKVNFALKNTYSNPLSSRGAILYFVYLNLRAFQ